jgi:hypothetical protein
MGLSKAETVGTGRKEGDPEAGKSQNGRIGECG